MFACFLFAFFLFPRSTGERVLILGQILNDFTTVLKGLKVAAEIRIVNFFINFHLFLIDSLRIILVPSVRLNIEQLFSITDSSPKIRISTVVDSRCLLPCVACRTYFLQILDDLHTGPVIWRRRRWLFHICALVLGSLEILDLMIVGV